MTLKQRQLCREAAGVRGTNVPVEIVSGNSCPAMVGSGYHYETRGGRRVYYPSAYSKVGWSNLVYCPSTRRVQVGEQWLLRRALSQVIKSLPMLREAA